MKRFGVALGIAVAMASALAVYQTKVEAKATTYQVQHWDKGSKTWSVYWLSLPGCINHDIHHPNDITDCGQQQGPR